MEYRKVGFFSKEYSDVRKLYISAFPKIERIPYINLALVCRAFPKHFSLYGIYKDGKFVSMLYYIYDRDWTILMFFAVREEFRNQGIGEKILKDVFLKFKYVTVIMESLFVPCDNMEQRSKRYAFYTKCGLLDTGYTYIDNSEEKYDVLGNEASFNDGKFRFSEFEFAAGYYRKLEPKSRYMKKE